MNLQQLEYIIAVDNQRHFVKASEKCFVTQATLSMMIKKLEDELEVRIFDRSKQPVVPTDIGEKIIAQAKVILREAMKMKDLIKEDKGEISGEIRLGIIPTLAPYLLPLFLKSFLEKYPLIKLSVHEHTTEEIIKKLLNNDLDAALAAIPLNQSSITEQTLFYEEFLVYASPKEKVMKKKYLLPGDIDINRLWMLEEGHCLRSQVVNLCELKRQEKEISRLDFSSGSIETLKKMVDINGGITIIPALSANDLSKKQKNNIRNFRSPAPVREIGLITHRYYVKERLTEALKNEIMLCMPKEMKSAKKKEVVDIHE
jgi:LysR family transcriptional regulator, hydrogen peroxide-inducible genes activator